MASTFKLRHYPMLAVLDVGNLGRMRPFALAWRPGDIGPHRGSLGSMRFFKTRGAPCLSLHNRH